MAITEAATDRIDRVWQEVMEEGEMAVVDEALTSDYELVAPGEPEVIRGREGFKQYKQAFHAAFPDLSVTIEDRIEGEEAIVDRFRLRGTHEGEFKGIPPTGTEVEFTGTIIHYLEEGKVRRDVSEFDVLDIMQQLGVVEGPTA
jgi:steroid delta-isomerase-like uncharacterized protein